MAPLCLACALSPYDSHPCCFAPGHGGGPVDGAIGAHPIVPTRIMTAPHCTLLFATSCAVPLPPWRQPSLCCSPCCASPLPGSLRRQFCRHSARSLTILCPSFLFPIPFPRTFFSQPHIVKALCTHPPLPASTRPPALLRCTSALCTICILSSTPASLWQVLCTHRPHSPLRPSPCACAFLHPVIVIHLVTRSSHRGPGGWHRWSPPPPRTVKFHVVVQ